MLKWGENGEFQQRRWIYRKNQIPVEQLKTIPEINPLDGYNRRLDTAEDRTDILKHQEKKIWLKLRGTEQREKNARDTWDTVRRKTYLSLIETHKGRDNGAELIFESVRVKKFP